MICKYCGQENLDDTKICQYCGENLGDNVGFDVKSYLSKYIIDDENCEVDNVYNKYIDYDQSFTNVQLLYSKYSIEEGSNFDNVFDESTNYAISGNDAGYLSKYISDEINTSFDAIFDSSLATYFLNNDAFSLYDFYIDKNEKDEFDQLYGARRSSNVLTGSSSGFNGKKIVIAVAGAAIVIALGYTVNQSILVRKQAAKDYLRMCDNEILSKSEVQSKMQSLGYSNSQIKYAMNSYQIDFDYNALQAVFSIAETSYYFLDEDGLRSELENRGYTQKNIDYALINFDEYQYITSFVNKVLLSERSGRKSDIIRNFENRCLSESTLQQVINEVDWYSQAGYCAGDYLSTYPSASKNSAISYLREWGYSEDEIEYGLSFIDWGSIISRYVDDLLRSKARIERPTIRAELLNSGYDEYDVENVLYITDFTKVVNFYINDYKQECKNNYGYLSPRRLEELLTDYEFTSNEFYNKLYDINWDSYALDCLKNKENTIHTKIDAENLLYNEDFNSNSVNYAMRMMNWNNIAKNDVNHYIELGFRNKTDISEYMYSDGFTSSEVNNAINSIDWNEVAYRVYDESSTSCIGRNDVRMLLENYGFSNNEIKSVINRIDWYDKALQYADYYTNDILNGNQSYVENNMRHLEFTSQEISYAINEIKNIYSEPDYNE